MNPLSPWGMNEYVNYRDISEWISWEYVTVDKKTKSMTKCQGIQMINIFNKYITNFYSPPPLLQAGHNCSQTERKLYTLDEASKEHVKNIIWK